MKISKEQIIGFVILLVFFTIIGFSIDFPVIGFASKKVTLFEAVSPIELFYIFLTFTLVYFFITYFISPSGVLQQLKSYKEPLQKVQTGKFDYWLKSLLFDDEIKELDHLFNVELIKGRIESGRINVLVETAKLNDMTVSTFLKHLTAEAEVNLTNAKTQMEKTKAETLMLAIKGIEKFPPIWQAYIISCVIGSTREFHNDLDIQRDITEYVKQMKEQEVKKAKAEADAFEQKMKHEQKKYTSNDKV